MTIIWTEMTDFFTAEPPPYGSITDAEAREMYESDPCCWYRYAAQGAGKKLLAGGEVTIRMGWPLMSDDYKIAVWATFDRAQRAVIRAALDGARGGDPEKVPA